MKRPVTNVLKMATEGIKELHEINIDSVMKQEEKKYEDCFPAYFSKTVLINGKEYYLVGELNLKEKK